jgi:hypothetical protein
MQSRVTLATTYLMLTRNLYTRTRMIKQSFVSVYRVSSVTIFRWDIYCTIKRRRFTINACYSWEMALNVGFEDWKGIREKAGEVNSTKACITDSKSSR